MEKIKELGLQRNDVVWSGGNEVHFIDERGKNKTLFWKIKTIKT